MKKICAITFALLVPFSSYSQSTHKYPIGEFAIDPVNRYVYSSEMTGGSFVNEDGSITHWDGAIERPDPRIDYETTSLIVFGNFVTFKEYFPSKCSFRGKMLRVDLGYKKYLCVKSGRRLYTFYKGDELEIIKIAGCKHITDCVFRGRNGKIYFLMSMTDRTLTELTQIENLDLPSLQHVTTSYYTDRNGLYFFGCERSSRTGNDVTTWNHSGKLEDSGGQTIVPVVGDGYMVYGGAVYSTKDEFCVSKLELDGNLLNEISFEQYGDGKNHYLTDGTNIYRKWGTSRSWEKTSIDNVFLSGSIDDHPEQWKCVNETAIEIGMHRKIETTYFFPSVERKNYSGGRLYHSGNDFFVVRRESSQTKPVVVKIDSALIHNFDTQQYEPLEINQYRHLTRDTYIYKNHLYNYGQPILNDINLNELEFIKGHSHRTNFLWDGKTLLHIRTFNGFDKTDDGYLIFRKPLVQNVDIETLKVIGEDLLLDKNNIYSANHDGITVIPMRELGLSIIVNTK